MKKTMMSLDNDYVLKMIILYIIEKLNRKRIDHITPNRRDVL